MGFFTDAYDLFIISVVKILKDQWSLSATVTTAVDSVATPASANWRRRVRRAADVLGRRRIYGLEVLVLAPDDDSQDRGTRWPAAPRDSATRDWPSATGILW
jgi:hypothetical protein